MTTTSKDRIFVISEEAEMMESDLDYILEIAPENPLDLMALAVLESDGSSEINMVELVRPSFL